MAVVKGISPRDLVNVSTFGAAGDGRMLETRNLQAAIDACHQQGGGTVVVPAGRYLTGTLFLRSNITLQLNAGAVLLGSENPGDYPVIAGRWEGAEQDTYAPLILGQDLRNVSVTGNGILDGRGEVWWKRFEEKTLAYPRPRLLSFSDCENVLVEGIALQNSPSWTVHPIRCTNVVIRGITILNPPDSPNTDGINPDSSCSVHISDCHVSAGDDCIAIKSGSERERPDRRASARDITITNCTLARGHGGIVIGSETNGGVRNVTVSNCVFSGTDRGIRIKSRRGRGGFIEDVHASNLVMTGVLSPFTVNLYYACGAWGDQRVSDKRPQPSDDGTPRIRRIHLSHITAHEVQQTAGFIYGLPELPLEEITLRDISVSLAAESKAGFPEMADGLEQMRQAGLFLRNANRVVLENVEIAGQSGSAFQLMDVSDVRFLSCGTPTPDPDTPVVSMNNVSDALLQDCHTGSETEVFLRVEGARSQHVELIGNSRIRAKNLIQSAADVLPEEIRLNPQATA